MPSAVFYPVATTDTGYWTGAHEFFATGWDGVVAVFGNNGSAQNAFVRFPVVTIPPGATVTAAFVRFASWSALAGTTCRVNVRGELAANAAAPTSAADASGRPKSTAVAWTPGGWTSGSSYDSPDLSTALAEILAVSGWASGNAVQLHFLDNASTSGARRAFDTVGYGSGYPELHVTWDVDTRIPGVDLALGVNPPTIPLALPQTVDLLIAANPPVCSAGVSVPGAALSLGANPPGFYSQVTPPTVALALYAGRPSASWVMPADQIPTCKIVYILTLTGDGDGLDDIVLPMSSFSTRMTADSIHYLSAYVPNSRAWADAIAARMRGDLVVKKGLRRSEYALRLAMERYEAAAQAEAEAFRASQFGVWLETMAAQTALSTTAGLMEQWLIPAYAPWGDRITPAIKYFIYGWQSADGFIAWYVDNGYAGVTSVDWRAAVDLLQTPAWLSAATGGYYTSWSQLCGLDGGDPYIQSSIMALTNDKIARRAEYLSIKDTPDDWMGAGQIMSEIIRVPFGGLSWERGGAGDIAVVTGQSIVRVAAVRSTKMTGIQYEALDTSGKRRLRCDVSLFLAPGDVATWGDQGMIVGQISHNVGPDTAYMEVIEQ
ncbi:MAG: hypothetical protein ACLGQH_09740 [Acidobacteriota bacterium]